MTGDSLSLRHQLRLQERHQDRFRSQFASRPRQLAEVIAILETQLQHPTLRHGRAEWIPPLKTQQRNRKWLHRQQSLRLKDHLH